MLAAGTQLHADAIAQPVGAGTEAMIPAAARVELTDELEQARGGGVEVGGQLGDLVAETIELSDRVGGRDESTLPMGRLYTRVLERPESGKGGRFRGDQWFFNISAR